MDDFIAFLKILTEHKIPIFLWLGVFILVYPFIRPLIKLSNKSSEINNNFHVSTSYIMALGLFFMALSGVLQWFSLQENGMNKVEKKNSVSNDNKTPDGTIKKYYELLKEGDEKRAWNILGESYQRKKFGESSGSPVDGYSKWWGEIVEKIEIHDIKFLSKEASKNNAKVEIKLIYRLSKKDQCMYDSSEIHLKKVSNNWFIYDKDLGKKENVGRDSEGSFLCSISCQDAESMVNGYYVLPPLNPNRCKRL